MTKSVGERVVTNVGGRDGGRGRDGERVVSYTAHTVVPSDVHVMISAELSAGEKDGIAVNTVCMSEA